MTVRQQKRPLNRQLVSGLIQRNFLKGYISTLADSRIPIDGLADMTNAVLEQDGMPRPRPGILQYGPTPLGTVIGMGKFVRTVSGVPQRWQIWMVVIGGVGQVVVNKDGGSYTTVGGVYNASQWTNFTQSNNRVYITNGTDTMSYYDITMGTLVSYTAISTPSAPTVNQHNLGGTNTSYRYRVAANNGIGSTAASVATIVSLNKTRNQWNPNNDEYIDVSWTAVSGATSYNVYFGTGIGDDEFLVTVTGTTYRDNNTDQPNPFQLAPESDSTKGPVLKNLIDSNGQLFGVGDRDNPSYLWYSGSGTNSGNFSPFSGGGYVAIDYGGDSIPVAVKTFHDGKGDTVVSVLTKGSAGAGKLYHVTFASQTVGSTVITYPQVVQANGQTGTVSPMAVVENDNGLSYPTGTSWVTTGTQQGVVNILVTNSVSQAIEVVDIPNLNLSAMSNAVGLAFGGKEYYAVPNNSATNNEIWIRDTSRNGLWILRWTVAAKYMMLYEDNNGNTHFLILTQDNKVGEFTRNATPCTDFGVPFNTRVASGSIVFGPTGLEMADVQYMRFKLLYPAGNPTINVYGLENDGTTSILLGTAQSTYIQSASFSGFDEFIYDSNTFDDEIGTLAYTSVKSEGVPLEIDDELNEVSWEIVTSTAGADYLLASVEPEAYAIFGERYDDD